jgi:hypothetical protein
MFEYSPNVWLANIQKTVIKQFTRDLTLSKLTGTAHGHNLFHWTLINLLSPTSLNEKITRVYVEGKNSTPNLTSHRHPQVKLIARVSVAGVSPAHHWVWTQDLFVVRGPRTLYQCMAITLRPTPSYILSETCQKSQHDLKLCKNNATLFRRYITCQKSQHTLKSGKH